MDSRLKGAWRALGRSFFSLMVFALAVSAAPQALAATGGAGLHDAHPHAEIVFVEGNVADYQSLVRGIDSQAEVHVLDAARDGMAQMAQTLAGRRGIDAVHIVSHGAEATLQLGALTLNAHNLNAHAAELAAIGRALNPQGAILLYGCNVAQGVGGSDFVDRFSAVAGAAVAASTDATGSPALGGNWRLEKRTGAVDATLALGEQAQAGYGHLLALPNGWQDVTPYTIPGNFLPGFMLTNDTPSTSVFTDDPLGLYFYNRVATSSAATLTVRADGVTVGSFDLNSVAMPFFTGSADTLTVVFTGYKADGSPNVSTTGVIDSNNALAGANFSAFTGITGFSFTVTAVNSTGDMTWDGFTISNAAAPATVPGAPTSVTATAGDAQATVSFTAPASDGGAAISTYTATASPGGRTGTCAGPAACPITVAGLTNGTAYTFTVTATNSAGTGSASTVSSSVTPKAAQTITFANPGAQNFGTAPTLSATASSGLSVSFTSSTSGVCTVTSGGALTFVHAGTCTINADQAGDGTYAAAPTVTQSFTVNAVAPGAPSGVSAVAGDRQATISFSAPVYDGGASITGYTATSTPSGFTGTCASSPCTVSGLTNGITYTFTMTATNSAGTGAASVASNSVTPKVAQTITFANPGAQNFGTTPTLSATASSSLTVSFTSSTLGVCTVTSGGALSFTSAGSCTINANQAGDGTYAAAPTVTQSFTVNAVAPGAPTGVSAIAGDSQAAISFTAPASNGGASITGYTATSTPSGFTGTCASSPCTVTGLTNGSAYTFTVTATNSAGTGAVSVASNSVTPKAAQTITFATPGAQNFGTTPTLSATASSGLTVSFTSSTTGVCTVTTGGTLTFVATGSCTINADQAGNAAYLAASTVTRSFAVNAVVPAAPTIGTATAGNAQATVAFTPPTSDGGATITGYTATSSPGGITGTCTSSPCTVSSLTNGTAYTFTVTATNSAGTGAASSSSNSVTPMATVPSAPTIGTATAGDTQASVSFSAPASDGGATITGYTATSSPGGFTGNCASSPCTVTHLSNGTAYTFTVTATNSAGTGAASTASNSVTPQMAQTISFSNPGAQNFGTTPTLTATASSGLTVSFTSGTSGVCTVTTGGALTFVTAGTCSINADQAGNAATAAAPTVTQSFTVNAVLPGAPTIGTATAGDTQASVAFAAPASNGGATITGYTATSSPGGFTGTCASSPCTVSGLTNGTAYTFTVTATNSAGTGAASSASNSVTPSAGQTITFSNPGAQNFGTTPTLTATASSGLTVSFSSTTATVCTITTGGALTLVAPGTCSINADQAGNSAYAAALTVTQSFSVLGTVPGVPTGVSATPGNAQATVTFTAPTYNGGSAITGYTATSSPGGRTGSCAGAAACTLTVSGLTNGTAYTFTVTATNGTGTSGASAASNAVTPTATPVAGAASMQYQLNTAVTLDLAPYITGTSVSITTAPRHGSISVSGTQVTYTPLQNYFGSDSFAYAAVNGGLTSAPATVAVTFNGTRPDPTANADVSGVVSGQSQTVQRFSRAQLFNFQQRMEWLHHSGPSNSTQQGTLMPTSGALAMTTDRESFAGAAASRLDAQPTRLAMGDAPNTGNAADVASNPPAWLTTVAAVLKDSALTIDVASLSNNDAEQAGESGAVKVWGAGNVRIGTKRQSDGATNIDYSTDGVTLGADRRISDNLSLGVGIGYAHDKSTIGTDGSDSSSDGTSIALYGSYQPDAISFVDGMIGYGALSMDSRRYVSGFGQYATASRSGRQMFGSIAAGYEYRDKYSLLSPYARYDITVDSLDAVTETGAGSANLNYSSQSTTAQQLSLGMRAELQRETDGGQMRPRARIEYQFHSVDGGNVSVAYADQASTRYGMSLPGVNANSLLIGVGSSFVLHSGLNIDVDVQFAHSTDHEDSQGFFVRFSKLLGGS